MSEDRVSLIIDHAVATLLEIALKRQRGQQTPSRQRTCWSRDSDETPTDDKTDTSPPADVGSDDSDTTDDGQQDDSQNDQPPQDDSNQSDDQNGNESDNGNETGTERTDGYVVKIIYDGSWSGGFATVNGDMKTIEGSGTEVIVIDGDPSIVSANAQKQDGGSETLTVQIIDDGEVIDEESTSAEFGVAQVTTSPMDDGSDDKQSPYTVKISYEGEWSGTIGEGTDLRTVDGSGTETFAIEGTPTTIVANAQKRDGGSGTLTVQILKNGEVIKEKSTSTEFGVVQVSADV